MRKARREAAREAVIDLSGNPDRNLRRHRLLADGRRFLIPRRADRGNPIRTIL